MFKRRDPTEEELREELDNAGITTKSNVGGREEKFGAFRQYATQRQQQRPGYAPVNPYANVQAPGGNPYAQGADTAADVPAAPSPYGASNASPYGAAPVNSHPAHNQPNPYARQSGLRGSGGPSAAAAARAPNPYAAAPTRPADRGPGRGDRGGASARSRDFDEELLDLNAMPSNTQFGHSAKPLRKTTPAALDTQSLDLNAVPEDDLNVDLELPAEEEVNLEDEEVEAIKQDIRFVKQELVALTRNTLRMAQEADGSATNTLGMLGLQLERLYNAEQNLLLADTQTSIAEDKVEQLRRLNRLIFIPATLVNPFNKKSKLRMQELKIKTQKAQEKYMRDANRQGVYESEQRIKEGLSTGDLHQKYKAERNLEAARRYQFENDSEDDEMEKELALNLDQIAVILKKLKGQALTMGREVDSQNDRLRKIEDDADRLDINVHMNTTRLSNIR